MSAPGDADFLGKTAIVTGACGFVGRRLCEYLAERGAAKVLALDVAAPAAGGGRCPASHSAIEFRRCDVTDLAAVLRATGPADCLWHLAALVGPFHARHRYDAVNHGGTLNALAACRAHGIPALVYASSPSARFDGRDVRGATEADLPLRPPGAFLEPYAESKALGERAVLAADGGAGGGLRTVVVAPHQVYGPRDPIFLPNLARAARAGTLRVFGAGANCVSMVHVDNYCHGLLLAARALGRAEDAARAGGQYFVVTDGGRVRLWDALDQAAVHLGYASVRAKMRLPRWLLMLGAYAAQLVARVTGRSAKLTPFTVRMLTIDRWFDISKARDVLGYKPLVRFEDGWRQTLDWFKDNPEFIERCAEKTSDNKVFERAQS